ncbi:hypothetical protein KCP71_04075 [Salmonella enterica subsp. enterica]|nr:hypothetical protein KCP71_04075 [Salmonella enterica subsp. enterica]
MPWEIAAARLLLDTRRATSGLLQPSRPSAAGRLLRRFFLGAPVRSVSHVVTALRMAAWFCCSHVRSDSPPTGSPQTRACQRIFTGRLFLTSLSMTDIGRGVEARTFHFSLQQ